jgi:hypothetical protein
MCWKRAIVYAVDYVIGSLVIFRGWFNPPVPIIDECEINRNNSQDTQEELTNAANKILNKEEKEEKEPMAKVELKTAELLPTKNIKICLEIIAGSNGFSIFIPPNQQEGFDKPQEQPRPPRPEEEPPADFGKEDIKVKLDMGSFALPEEDLRTKPEDVVATEEEEDINIDNFQTSNENENQSGSEDDV